MLEKAVDMLCVMATSSSNESIRDQIQALEWGLGCSKHIVIVDDGHKIISVKNGVTVLPSSGKIHHTSRVGFKVNEGISWAINNIQFKCAMALDDDALIIKSGLDKWVFDVLKNDNIGIVGVKDANLANFNYSKPENKVRCMEKLKSYTTVPADFEIPDEYVFYAVNFQPYSVLKKLYDLGLLSWEREDWPLPCESYQSTITKMIGKELFFVGQYPDNLKPPLYVMHHGSVLPPDPRHIDKGFLIHHSIKNVANVQEWDIRNYYKKERKPKWIL